jgi:hypothetical protein
MNPPTRDLEPLAASKTVVPYRRKTYHLLGTHGHFCNSSSKGLFGGNTRGKIFGQRDRSSALPAIERGKTYEQYRVFFTDETTAIAAGFRPCAIYMRQAYNKWQASRPYSDWVLRSVFLYLSAVKVVTSVHYVPDPDCPKESRCDVSPRRVLAFEKQLTDLCDQYAGFPPQRPKRLTFRNRLRRISAVF